MSDVSYTLADILESTKYALDIFEPQEVAALTLYEKNGEPYLRGFCNRAYYAARKDT